MRTVLLASLLALVALAGCKSDYESDGDTCAGYGLERGSKNYIQCMIERDRQRRAIAAAFLGIQMQQPRPAYQVPVYQLPMPTPAPVRQPVNTNCLVSGNMVNCSSY